MWTTRFIYLCVYILSCLAFSRAQQDKDFGTIVAGSTTFPLNDRSEDCIQNLSPEFDGQVGVELKRCIREIHTTAGQQGQIVSGSTTFPLNEDTENCANRVQQVNPKKPGQAVSKCLKTPLSTPAPDEPYFDPAGCSKLHLAPQQGQTLVLKCKVGNLGTNQITWLKSIKGHPTMISFGTHLALEKNDDRFSWAGNLNDTFDLEIANINSGDDGIYRCQIAGTTKSWNITIKVQVPPTIKAIQRIPGSDGFLEDRLTTKYMYNETDTIAIRCIPDGYPLPLVEWKKVNERTPVSISPNLTIINANRNHTGVYSCQVKTYGIDSYSPTGPGETEKRIEIVVQYKPEVLPKRTDIREPAGEYVQLECSVSANPPAAYTWLKDDVAVPEYHSQIDKPKSTRLIILSLDPENDYGNYTCTATNALGSAVGYIEVSGKPLKPVIKSGTLSNKKHSYRLVWTTGQNGDPTEDASFIPIRDYIIQYQGWWYLKQGNKMNMQFSQKDPLVEFYKPEKESKRHSYFLRDLRDNITYDVYLFGRNQYGDGEKAFFQFKTNVENQDDPTVTPTPTQSLSDGGRAEPKIWYPPQKGSGTKSSSSSLIISLLLSCVLLQIACTLLT